MSKNQKCHSLKIEKSNVENQPGFWVLGYWGEIGVLGASIDQ
jgi:hypothetical protein